MAALVGSDDAVIGRKGVSERGVCRSLHQVRVKAEQRRAADRNGRGSRVEIGKRQAVVAETCAFGNSS